MADSSDIDVALVAKLLADPTLMEMLPDGVWIDLASPHAERVLVVRQITHLEIPVFPSRTAYERFHYEIVAMLPHTSAMDVKAAAARIQTLLHDGTLPATGYSLMTMQRLSRIRRTEYDADADRRWHVGGGLYLVEVQPT